MARTLSQTHFILTSLSGIVMGVNCVLFCFCVYALWGQHRRVLLLASTVQFLLCIVQTALFNTYLATGFTMYAGGSEVYFKEIIGFALPCYLIYLVNYAIEEVLLIWRIYVLYNYNILWCIPTIILLLLQLCMGGITAKGFATEATITGPLYAFNLTTWALIAAVNVSATVLLCTRLWIARQRASGIHTQSTYKSTIAVVVECGALVTLCTIAMLVLHAVEQPGVLAGVGFMTQVGVRRWWHALCAVLVLVLVVLMRLGQTTVPLLIVARYAMWSRKEGDEAFGQVPLRVSVVQTEVTRVDAPVAHKTRRLSDGWAFVGGNAHKPFRDV